MASQLFSNAVSLFEEAVSYETLWELPSASLKVIAGWFKEFPGLPSMLLRRLQKQFLFSDKPIQDVRNFVGRLDGFSVNVHRCFQYPASLRDARYPIELFYYRGEIDLAETRCVSVVGARKASDDGLRRAAKLASELVAHKWTIVSGLASGIDTAAMTVAIKAGGRTIGVIGTPINETYPRDNVALQEEVASRHLLISQVPFYHYSRQPFVSKKYYFPQRNETMAAFCAPRLSWRHRTRADL